MTLTLTLNLTLTKSFLELHSSAQLISAEGAEAMAAVVEWMRNYAP